MTKRNAAVNTIIIAVILLSALCIGFAWPGAKDTSEKINWKAGDLLKYRYSAANKTRISDPAGGKGEIETDQLLEGDIFIKIFDLKQDAVLAVSEFKPKKDTTLSGNTLLEYPPFQLDFSKDGYIKEIRLPEGLPKKSGKKLRGILDTLKITFQPGTSSWNSNEENLLGDYTAKYSKSGEPRTVRKEILEYAALKDTSGYADRVEVIDSETVFDLSEKSSWINSLSSTESIKLYNGNKLQLTSSTAIELESAEYDPSEIPEWAKTDYKSVLAAAGVPDRKEDALIFNKRSKESYQKAMTSYLDKLQTSPKSHEILKITDLMAQDLKNEPSLIDDLLNVLKDGSYTGQAGAHTVYALQKTGTDKAQDALRKMIESPEYHDYNKRRALIALGGMEINQATEQFLWSLSEQFNSPENGMYAESAVYALGSSAQLLSESAPERSEGIVVKLSENLVGALEVNDYKKSAALVLAIGNSSAEEAISVIHPLLEFDSDIIRAATAEAMSNTEDEEGALLLSERLLDEESPRVREKIIYSLNKRAFSPEILDSIEQAVAEEEDDQNRKMLAAYLLKASKEHKIDKERIKVAISLESNRDIYNILSQALIN